MGNRTDSIRQIVGDLFTACDLDYPVVLNTICSYLDIFVTFSALPHSIDGMTATDDFGYLVVLNPLRPKPRIRFTLAHEIGHVALGHCESDDLHMGSSSSISAPHMARLDREANIFAAELLMPEGHVREHVRKHGLDIRSLQAKYKVSKRVVECRLKEVGLNMTS